MAHERPWASVFHAPTEVGLLWFKACGRTQWFEPTLTAGLSARWPERVTEVLAHDADLGWLLMADAGTGVATLGNAPEIWLRALPLYAELQRGEASRVADHLQQGVPDLRLDALPAAYGRLLREDLPLRADEVETLRRFEPRFAALCADLAVDQPLESIQHDDLHLWNLYTHGTDVRVIDWGDSSVAHPFQSLVVTFRFLEEVNGLRPTDPWFARLRDAYLEPWGTGLVEAFDRAMRIGAIAHAIASIRIRDALPRESRTEFDMDFAAVLRRAIAGSIERSDYTSARD